MKKAVFALLIITCFATTCFGWGSKGHKIIAEIARQYMNKNVIDSVQYYLGDMTFEQASVMMDEVRSDHTYDYMKPWHYVNVEKDKTYVKTKESNVVNEIQINIAALKNSHGGKEKMNFALKVLFHLVGDLHQPLHCGYAVDKGGNTIDIEFNGKKKNLHKLWDAEIIEKERITMSDCLKLANKLTMADKETLSENDVVEWMEESRGLLPGVYDFKTGVITQEYVDKNKVVIQKQLMSAEKRLAGILNQNFKK